MIEVHTPQELSDWIHTAKPGKRCVYYRGLLMMDRALSNGVVTPELVTARKAWGLSQAKRVALTQARVGPFDCLYIAEKLV